MHFRIFCLASQNGTQTNSKVFFFFFFFYRRENFRDSVENFFHVDPVKLELELIHRPGISPGKRSAALRRVIAREIIMHQISCGLSRHRGTSETHRRCLRLHRLCDTHIQKHTQRDTRKTPRTNERLYHPGKARRYSVCTRPTSLSTVGSTSRAVIASGSLLRDGSF